MTVVSASAERLFTKSGFCQTADGIVILFCLGSFDAGDRINVDATELLATFPAPGTSTSCVQDKGLAS